MGNSAPMVITEVSGGKGGQGRAMRIQQTKRDRAEGNQPAILVFRDAYQLSNQCLTHKDEFSTPLDLSVGTYPSHLRQRGVLNVSKLFGIQSRRGHIPTSRGDLAQGLMRAQLVIHGEEAVAPFLLSLGTGCRRVHDLLLEGKVESFVSSVLLRMSWLDALGHNPQLDPPHREVRQSSSTYGGKGGTIVGADSQRQAVLPENTLKHGMHMGIIRLGEDLAAKKHASTGIADGQGIAACPVTGANPTLEIGAPDVVGSVSTQEWLKPRTIAPAALAPGHQPMQAQNPTPSANCRPRHGYLRGFVRARRQLGRSPGRMSLLGSYYGQRYLGWRSPRTPMRSAGALLKSRNAFISKAPQPLMGRFPAHTKVIGQLCHRILTSLIQAYHLQSLFHGTGLLPRQGNTSLPDKLPVTYVLSKGVTSVSGLHHVFPSPLKGEG